MNNDNLRIYINSKKDLKQLVKNIKNNIKFANNVIFKGDFLNKFFVEMDISKETLYNNRFFYDDDRKLHISFCIDEDIIVNGLWVSTYGLVCYKNKDYTSSNYVNALHSQRIVILLLAKEARSLIQKKEVYDTTGLYDELRYLAQAFFQNWLFFFELVGKCYLSLCNAQINYTHKLDNIYKLVTKTMFQRNDNDSLFHLLIIHKFQTVVNQINMLPTSFKEEYIKYNDNENDGSLIVFNEEVLDEIEQFADVAECVTDDFDYKDRENTSFFKQGVYKKRIEQATDEEDRRERQEYYKFLINEPDNYI